MTTPLAVIMQVVAVLQLFALTDPSHNEAIIVR